MKRYRVEFERKLYKDKMFIELSASNISEAVFKAREFIEKAYGINEIGYFYYVIKSVSCFQKGYQATYSNWMSLK